MAETPAGARGLAVSPDEAVASLSVVEEKAVVAGTGTGTVAGAVVGTTVAEAAMLGGNPKSASLAQSSSATLN